MTRSLALSPTAGRGLVFRCLMPIFKMSRLADARARLYRQDSCPSDAPETCHEAENRRPDGPYLHRVDRGDTSFALSLEAQRRGHHLFHYTPDRLSLRDGKVFARIEAMQLRDEKGNHYSLGEKVRTDLSEMDVILLRQDPPFDMKLHHHHAYPRANPSKDAGRQRPRLECATAPRRSSSPSLPT